MRRLIWMTLICCLWSGVYAYGPVDRGRSVFTYKDCRSCHGAEGLGSKTQQAPNLAGREPWYLEAQLRKFRDGVRGTHQADAAGKIMAPVSQTLDDTAITDVAAFLVTLDGSKPEHTLKGGDIARGRTLYQACIACHGNRGQGNRQLSAPQLKHLNDWYIVAQLKHFKAGIRGTHPKDLQGAMMRPFAQTLPDRQAMEDLATYIKTFK